MVNISSSTTIFLDFDDTLFDYSRAVNWLLEEIEPYGISKLDWDKTYAQIKKRYGLYNRVEHFKLMSEKISKDIDLLAIQKKYITKTDTSIFKDATRFLERYKENPIYIISYGETEYQMEKILNTNMTKYTKDIVVTRGNKADAIAQIPYESAIFIDDRVGHLQDVFNSNKCKNITTILIDRSGKHEEGKVRTYEVISTLDDL